MRTRRHLLVLALLLAGGSLHAQAFAEREQTISGTVSDETPKVYITVTGNDCLPGCRREYLADVTYPAGSPPGTPGPWSQAVRYFPGSNTVVVHSARTSKTTNPTVTIAPPALRVQLEWAGNDHDYDLYVNAVNWTNKVTAEGTLDRDAYASSNDTGAGVENITFDAAAAGTYQVYVNYFSHHNHPGESDPTTVRIFLGKSTTPIFTQTFTLTTAEAHGSSLAGDGKSVWNVATVVVHGAQPGGYRVVDEKWNEVALGLRDIFLGKDDKPLVIQEGNQGVFPRTTFQVSDLKGPYGTDRVVLAVGQSAQIVATGTVNAGSANQQTRAILGQFTSSDPGVALVDELGVVTGLTGGLSTISTSQGGGSIAVHVIDVRLSADTDRSGAIAVDADRPLKEVWSRHRGAIYNVNYNDSNGDHQPDVISFDDTGAPTNEQVLIQDPDDVTPLLINKPGTALPAGATLFLKVGAPEQIRAIHVYRQRAVGMNSDWGGLTAVAASTATEIDITSWLDPAVDAQAGLEGLLFRNTGAINPFAGFVEFTMELRDKGAVIKKDVLMLKVAPWLILPNDQTSQEAWIWNDPENAVTRNATTPAEKAAGYYGMEDSGQLHLGSVPAEGRWLQDHLEIGYTQRPGGPKTQIVFRLPYFRGGGTPQPSWPLTDLLRPGVGIFQLGRTFGAGSGDYGGNLEALLPDATNKMGRIVIGDTSSATLQDFLTSQEVQPAVVTVPVRWLGVGHLDEVLCFLPGNRVALADPDAAWTLLSGMPAAERENAVFFATGGNPVGNDVGAVVELSTATGTVTRIYDGPAVGSITAVSDDLLADGETFTITDSAGLEMVFEFDKDGVVAGDNFFIFIQPQVPPAVRTASEVRDLILTAIGASGVGVQAIADGADKVHLWSASKGLAGNQAIGETVAAAGFTVEGMELGKDDGFDFTTRTGWKYLRSYALALGPPDVTSDGATAELSAWADGYVETSRIWRNGSHLVDGPPGIRDHYRWSLAVLLTDETYVSTPDRYVLCQDGKLWASGVPAIVSVAEVLADPAFEALNRTDAQGIIWGGAGTVQQVITDAAAAAPTFVRVPCLYFGTRAGFATARSAAAFNPNPANLQLVGGDPYVPRQFGPRDAAGNDVFEASIGAALGGARFVDDWLAYHVNHGEIHCGTAVKREPLALDWWANIPAPGP